MAIFRSGDDAMRDYARSRVQDAEQALGAHRRDGVGCCVACGRPAPCDDMARAGQLREHYRAWLDGARSWVDDDHVAVQIRPYLLRGRNDNHAA
jgi:hypothetical protein